MIACLLNRQQSVSIAAKVNKENRQDDQKKDKKYFKVLSSIERIYVARNALSSLVSVTVTHVTCETSTFIRSSF